MVEFVLLFALGFLTALLLVLFIAPAIHGRIIKFTERRLRATVPMSAAELKAAVDMERAAHAVENRRIAIDLRGERDKLHAASRRADELNATVARMRGDKADLLQQIDQLSVEAGDLRSTIRKEELRADKLKLALAGVELDSAGTGRQIDQLQTALRRMTIEVEDMKIDVAARDTEVESLKSTIEALNDERRRLREDIKTTRATATDLKFRLEREETRNDALEQKLTDTIAKLSDQESTLDRRGAEIARLKERLAGAANGAKDKAADPKSLESERNGVPTEIVRKANGSSGNETHRAEGERDAGDKTTISQRVEKLRARHTALVERLTNARDERSDAALRKEIREIAAAMVSLTAQREGRNSPIHGILAGATEAHSNRGPAEGPSLAARAAQLMGDEAERP